MSTAEQTKITPPPERKRTFTPPDSMLLRLPSYPVTEGELHTDDIKSMVEDLLIVSGAHTGYGTTGRGMVGLHAKQLGYNKNLMLVDWNARNWGSKKPDNYKPHYRLFINPEIVDRSNKTNKDAREGCWSSDGDLGGHIARHDHVTLNAWEVDLELFERTKEIQVIQIEETTTDSYVARIVQHEVDHGLGKRFPSHARHAGDLYRITDRDAYFASAGKLIRRGFKHVSAEEFTNLKSQASPLK